MKKLCVISLVLLIFTACSQYTPSVASLTASIISSYDNPVVIRVFMEGNDGNYITGARVHITNPGGQLESAGFTTNEGCYKGYFEELLSGEYTITVYSPLLPQTETMVIQHTIPEGSPFITQLSDEGGNNALLGNPLNGNSNVSVRWDPVTGGGIYVVSLKRGVNPVWTQSLSECALTIPSLTMADNGSYTLSITSQCITGDPFLIEEPYYSVSESRPVHVLFSVENK